jgi:predicted transcriptional regulator
MSDVSSIRRSRSKDNYTRIDNAPIRDEKISWKAKGLLIYLLHLPDNWVIRVADLQTRSKDGRDATQSGIRELIKAGYILREKKPLVHGKFNGYQYTVFDRPEYAANVETETGETVDGFTVYGFPVYGKSGAGKPVTTNNEGLKTKELKTKETNNPEETVPQNEFAATNPEQPPTPKGAKKKKTSPGSGAPPPKIPAWTSKVKDLFDRVNEEESQSAKVEHIPYETTAAPGRDFAAFKALRTCIEKKIGTDPEETVLLSSFEYLFRYGFRYLHSIALSKGGAIQYSPLTIQHSYNQIRQYAASFNRKPADPIKDLAATFIAEHRAKVSGQI